MYDRRHRRTVGRGQRMLLVLVAFATGFTATTPPASADPVDEFVATVNEKVEEIVDLVDDGQIPPRNTGAGFSRGPITYTSAVKLPKVGAGCARDLTFELGDGDPTTQPDDGWASDAFVFNTVITGFAGPVTMTGAGNSDNSCENYSAGGGVMTVDLQGKAEANPTGSTLDCRDSYGDATKSTTLRGGYTRVASNMVVILTGKCVVNSKGTGQVTFIAVLQAVPSDPPNEGVNGSVERLVTAGNFVLVPA